jgi:hypothetical protein
MSEKPTSIQTPVLIRKAPKYLPFALTGFSLGITIALVLGLSSIEIVGLLVVLGGLAGGTIGILLALIFDLIYRGRGKKLEATKIIE